jgi:hypothetical protein
MVIQEIEDPAVTELARLAALLVRPCSFVYANLYEANFGLDALDESKQQFPVLLYITTGKEKNNTLDTGLIVRTVPVSLMLLDVLDSKHKHTADYSSREVDPKIHVMRQLSYNLLHLINESPLTHVPTPVEDFEVNKVYAKFDRHLFGVAVDFEWEINTNTKGC